MARYLGSRILMSRGITSRCIYGAALAAVTAWPPAAAAQPPDKPAVLPEVVVTATRVEQESQDLPIAIDLLDSRAIREGRPAVSISESLNRAPGIYVPNRQNLAQDQPIISRGFGARSAFGVRGVRLIADGIPATMPDGQGQASTFSLGSADRIEVMRGPFSSLYGNASGGVVQIFTADAPPEPTLSGSVMAGSYDTWKLGAQFGATRGAVRGIGDVSRFQTGGYRDHGRVRRDHLNAKASIDTPTLGRITLVANALDQPETEDPLGLTAAQVAQNRRQAGTNALAFNTRKSVAQSQLGVTWDFAASGRDALQARAYAGDRQVTQFLAIPLAVQQGATHSGGVIDLDRGYGGAGLRWTRRMDLGGAPLAASVGADYDRMAERRQGFINNLGASGELKRDEDDVVSSADFYAQAEWRVLPRLNLLLGARHSRVHFESTDYFIRGGNPDDSGAVQFVRTTPAAGASWALAPGTNAYANIGRGFETPTFVELAYRPGGATGLNFALRPARSLHREIGLKSALGPRARLNLALFRIDATDEIVVDTAAGGRTVFKNASGTRRKGFELALAGRHGRGFESAVSYTYLDAVYSLPFSSGGTAVPSGNRLPGVPAHTLFGEALWRHAASGFHAGVELRAAGKVYVNDANSEAAGAYALVNLRAGLEQRGRRWRLTEFVRVENVADRPYIGSVVVNDANGRFYEPAPTRNWLAGVQASFKF
jgi:iron complex outermembrane receptor protein